MVGVGVGVGVNEVSFTITLELAFPLFSDSSIVSAPSVVASFAKVNVCVALLLLILKLPVNVPALRSELLMPVIV